MQCSQLRRPLPVGHRSRRRWQCRGTQWHCHSLTAPPPDPPHDALPVAHGRGSPTAASYTDLHTYLPTILHTQTVCTQTTRTSKPSLCTPAQQGRYTHTHTHRHTHAQTQTHTHDTHTRHTHTPHAHTRMRRQAHSNSLETRPRETNATPNKPRPPPPHQAMAPMAGGWPGRDTDHVGGDMNRPPVAGTGNGTGTAGAV